MKFGIVSAIQEHYDFEEVMEFASANGFQCVELACWPVEKAARRYAGVCHLNVEELDAKRCGEIENVCRQKKVEISSLAYYPNIMDEDMEKRAFYDLIRDANVKAKKIMIVEKAIADGLGLDIDVKNSQGVLLVNVGYDTTEISILSLGGIVLSHLINVGGNKFDEAIRSAVRREFSLIIGGKTAENVKISLRDLEQEGKGATVYGRDIVTGLPVEREIPTSLVDEALQEHFSTIIDNIKVILERTPPELAADIYRHGLYLTGGASQVSHLGELISKGTGLQVNMAEQPVASVAIGLSRIIKDDNYKSVAYSIEGMGK